MNPFKYEFPIFKNNPDLVYLDSAATSHHPEAVIEAIKHYSEHFNSSPHRGAHKLSTMTTELYSHSKRVVADFINAGSPNEIIYTRNTTESLNLLAYSLGLGRLKKGDEIIVPITSHHSNILPWQMVARATGAHLIYLYTDLEGFISPDEYKRKIGPKTKILSVPIVSNGIGVRHNVEAILEHAKKFNVVTILDGAQAIGHEVIDVQKLDVDFLVFSGHKIFGPQGIGVLYGKLDQLNELPPFLYGGDMIEYVTEQDASYAPVPEKFEAGTQNTSGAIGLKSAIEFIQHIGVDNIRNHEQDLLNYALKRLQELDFVEIYGPNSIENRGALIVFNVKGVHPHDVATIMDSQDIAIRAGHHCCQPLMQYIGQASTCRVSFSIYNQKSDVDRLIDGLMKVKKVFAHEN